MVRGEKTGGKRNLRKRFKHGELGSNYSDSDEDYVISGDETDVSEDALEDLDVSVLDEDELEDEDEVEEEEDVEEEGCDSGKLNSRSGSSHGRTANNKSLPMNGAVLTKYEVEDEEDDEVENEEGKHKKSGSRRRSSRGKKSEVKVEDEEDDEDGERKEEEEVNEGEQDPNKPHPSPRSCRGKKSDKKCPRKSRAVPSEEEDDEEYIVNEEDEEDDDDEDDDDEFTPEEGDDYDLLEDEEDSARKKRTRSEIMTCKNAFKSKATQRSGKRNKRSKISTKASKKRGTEQIIVRRKSRSDKDDAGYFLKDITGWRRTEKKNTRRRKRRYVASSDSDFETSGSSDREYTISEDEREQVREANDFCGTVAFCIRKTCTSKGSVRRRKLSGTSSSSCDRNGESDSVANQPKPTDAKGKEKVEESNVVKQVCGICLSEEDKRKFRGTLDCCSHYFCFTCIREWSKVESRCPLCKQRFHTITKPARCTAGLDLREDVIHVPERDQVYQPTDEEIRDYLDPYESVICTECFQGGDDDLMLLCDICDSPAHTFCVGLGREVPEGSWYCRGCQPSALGSLSSQSRNYQRMSNNLSSWTVPGAGVTEGFDLNTLPSIQVLNLSSPRFPLGISRSLSHLSGSQVFTLSGRRTIYRHIQQRNGRGPWRGRTDGSSTSIFRNEPMPYPVDQGRPVALQPIGMEGRAPNVRSFGGITPENSFPALQRREIPVFAAPSTTDRIFLDGYAGVNLISVPEQSHQSSIRLSVSSDGGGAPPSMREQSYFCRPEEQLQAMIKTHLRSLCARNDLGYGDFKDVERSSIQNILAACGIGQWGSGVCAIPHPSVCSHVDITGNGQMSPMKGPCSACFDVFVREVVQNNLNAKLQQQWLSLSL